MIWWPPLLCNTYPWLALSMQTFTPLGTCYCALYKLERWRLQFEKHRETGYYQRVLDRIPYFTGE